MMNGEQRPALSRRTFLKAGAFGLTAATLAACVAPGAPAGGGATEGQGAFRQLLASGDGGVNDYDYAGDCPVLCGPALLCAGGAVFGVGRQIE